MKQEIIFFEEIKQNELNSKKHKQVCATLNYVEYFLILASTVTGSISISAFASLIGIPIGIINSAIRLKICAIASIVKKKENKHDKIILLARSKLNRIEVLISKTLIDSVFSHDEFVLINNEVKEYNDMKEEIKNLKT